MSLTVFSAVTLLPFSPSSFVFICVTALFFSTSFLSLLVLLHHLALPCHLLSSCFCALWFSFREKIVLLRFFFCSVLLLIHGGMFDRNFLSSGLYFSGACSSVDMICCSLCLMFYQKYSVSFFITYRAYGLNFPKYSLFCKKF